MYRQLTPPPHRGRRLHVNTRQVSLNFLLRVPCADVRGARVEEVMDNSAQTDRINVHYFWASHRFHTRSRHSTISAYTEVLEEF